MKLVDGWHKILLRAWSMWLVYLGIAFQILEGLLPYLDEYSFRVPRWVFILLTVIILAGAAYARVTPQPKLHQENSDADR